MADTLSMNKIKPIIISALVTIQLFVLNVCVQASTLQTDISGQFNKLDKNNVFSANLGTYFSRIIEVAIVIAALLTFAMIIWGGIEWITSGGDKSKYENARKRITSGIVGLALVAAAWAIWYIVILFFGLNNLDALQITGGSGSSGSTSAAGSCGTAEWRTAFASAHGGSQPTAQDLADCNASVDFANRCGRSPSTADWTYRYNNGGVWPPCN